MSGRARLPAGEPRKAGQRNSLRAAPIADRITPTWRAGDRVRWRDRTGAFRRDVGDGEHAEVVIRDRVYRVWTRELCLKQLLPTGAPGSQRAFRFSIQADDRPDPHGSAGHRSRSSPSPPSPCTAPTAPPPRPQRRMTTGYGWHGAADPPRSSPHLAPDLPVPPACFPGRA